MQEMIGKLCKYCTYCGGIMKNLIKICKAVIIFVVVNGLVFLAWAFALWSINPIEWGEAARVFQVFVGFSSSLLCLLLFGMLDE